MTALDLKHYHRHCTIKCNVDCPQKVCDSFQNIQCIVSGYFPANILWHIRREHSCYLHLLVIFTVVSMFTHGNLFLGDFKNPESGPKQDRPLEGYHNKYFRVQVKNGALLRTHKISNYSYINSNGIGKAAPYRHFIQSTHPFGKVL